jgi:hypothetical protein
MWDEPNAKIRSQKEEQEYHKSSRHVKTIRTWSWKSKSSKECVTTHESNVATLKMDGVYPPSDTLPLKQIYALQRVGGRGDYCEG